MLYRLSGLDGETDCEPNLAVPSAGRQISTFLRTVIFLLAGKVSTRTGFSERRYGFRYIGDWGYVAGRGYRIDEDRPGEVYCSTGIIHRTKLARFLSHFLQERLSYPLQVIHHASSKYPFMRLAQQSINIEVKIAPV